VDDRTAKARLRDAAIEIMAESGTHGLTARGVADRAGLSPGLIRHHFGSMSELVVACDQFVAATIRMLKEQAIQGTPGFDAFSALRRPDTAHLMGYLAMRLGDDSPHINDLVDVIVDDAVSYMSDGVDRGVFAPTPDEHRRAAMLTVFALGSLVMHRHLHRLLGVDIRSADLAAQPGFAEYLRVQMEVLSGVVTPPLLAEYRAMIDNIQEES
jgi:AcrR family transcriptional regulator